MSELITSLNTIKLMSDPLTDRINGTFKLRHLVKGRIFLREGDRTDPVIFVISGLIRFYQMEEGKELSKGFLLPNQMLINGTALDDGKPLAGFGVALTHTKAMICQRDELEKVYEEFPEFEHHGRILTYRCYSSIYRLLDNVRTLSAKDRYQFIQREFPELVRSVPSTHLASFLGINKCHLSRIRRIK